MLKKLIIFCTGAAVGGGAVYFYLRNRYDKTIQAILDSQNEIITEEIERFKAEYHPTEKSDQEKDPPVKEKIFHQPDKPEVQEMYNKLAERYKNPVSYSKPKEELQKDVVYSSEKEEDTDHNLWDDYDAGLYPHEGLDVSIYTISPMQFAHEPNFDKVTLFYYADNILAEEDSQIIEDPKIILGESALSKFGEFEENVVYVRNEKYSTDYEVIRESVTYKSRFLDPDV